MLNVHRAGLVKHFWPRHQEIESKISAHYQADSSINRFKSAKKWFEKPPVGCTISSPFFKTRHHGGFFWFDADRGQFCNFPTSFIITVLWVRFLKGLPSRFAKIGRLLFWPLRWRDHRLRIFLWFFINHFLLDQRKKPTIKFLFELYNKINWAFQQSWRSVTPINL